MAEQERYRIGKEEYRIRICDHTLDTIYGQIGITEVEKEIEKLTVFKRLHNISQLGLVNWIFPCALHTRYTHSIGVMHVAGEMASHINMNTEWAMPFFSDNDIQIIRLAGMLHDIGHYPMSHNVEQAYKDASDEFEKNRDSLLTATQRLKDITKCPNYLIPQALLPTETAGKVAEEERKKTEERICEALGGSTGLHHEYISNLLITKNQKIHKTVRDHFVLMYDGEEYVMNPAFAPDNNPGSVTKDEVNEITQQLLFAIGEMVRGNYNNKTSEKYSWLSKYSAMIQLIHSELDADNLDYLLRDATFSGTSYGLMDMGVLLNSLRVSRLFKPGKNQDASRIQYIVGVKRKGIGSVEQFLLNKFLAYTQMILSKYVSILESMLLCLEADYVIKNEEERGDEGYGCAALKKLVTKPNTSDRYYAFTDHHVFHMINYYHAAKGSMYDLPKKIVTQLNKLRAFDLDEDHPNEFICTELTREAIRDNIVNSRIYNDFTSLCESISAEEAKQLSEGRYGEDEYNAAKAKLFLFRFESYALTKQLPLNKFMNIIQTRPEEDDRRFMFHYYRLADGIPILEEDEYRFDDEIISGNNNADKVLSGGYLPYLCVDDPQSSLHRIYSMEYLSLRRYQMVEKNNNDAF